MHIEQKDFFIASNAILLESAKGHKPSTWDIKEKDGIIFVVKGGVGFKH